jgi:hypothetical protein
MLHFGKKSDFYHLTYRKLTQSNMRTKFNIDFDEFNKTNTRKDSDALFQF